MLWGRTRTCLVKVCHDSQCTAETLTYILKIVWEAKSKSLSAKQKRCWRVFLPSLPDETTELEDRDKFCSWASLSHPFLLIHTSGDSITWPLVIRGWNEIVCRKTDWTGTHHVLQNKTDSKGQISHVFFQMWILYYIYVFHIYIYMKEFA